MAGARDERQPGFGGQSFIDSALCKCEAARRIIETSGRDIRLEVDGGIKAGQHPPRRRPAARQAQTSARAEAQAQTLRGQRSPIFQADSTGDRASRRELDPTASR